MNQPISEVDVRMQEEYERVTRPAWKPVTQTLVGMQIESMRLVREVITNQAGEPEFNILSALTLQVLPTEQRSLTARARLNKCAKCLLNAGTKVYLAFSVEKSLDEIEIRGLEKRFLKETDPDAYKKTLAEIVSIAVAQATNVWCREESKEQALLITFQIDEVTDEFMMADWAAIELAQLPDYKVLLEFVDANTFVNTGAVRYRTMRLHGN